MKKYLLMMILLISSFNLFAQDIIMGNQGASIYDCNMSGSFYDSGGNSAGYSAGESFVLTICPTVVLPAGTPVSFTFNSATFGHAGDFLAFYDGAATTNPSDLLELFNQTNIPPVNTLVRTTISNPVGCITVQFVSDATSIGGNFDFTLGCSLPCKSIIADIPTSSIAVQPNDTTYINSCTSDSIIFTGNGIYDASNLYYPQSNATSSFYWEFGSSGIDSGQIVGKSFTPGIYPITLTIVDIEGCKSKNEINLKVRQAFDPIVFFDPQDTILCQNETFELSSYILSSIGDTIFVGDTAIVDTLQLHNSVTVVDTVFLPDDSDGTSGNGITTPAIYDFPISGYQAGSTLQNANELISICLDIEHSFVGDLDIVLECPNGQIVNLVDMSPPGTPGWNFGEPGAGAALGVPYTYCWSPSANPADVIADGNANTIANILPNGAVDTLTQYSIPGNAWGSLVGCPLNGTWQIQVFDDYGGDDGNLFGASIQFSDIYAAESDTFLVSYQNPLWSSSNQILSALDNDSITVKTVNPAFDTLVFNFENNLGCAYSENYYIDVDTFKVHITPQDTSFCFASNDSISIQLEGVISSCDYSIEMFDSWFGLDGWNGNTVTIFLDGINSGTFTIPNGSDYLVSTFSVIEGQQIQVQYNATGNFQTENAFNILDADGTIIFSDGFDIGGNNGTTAPASGVSFTTIASCGPAYTYAWGPNYNISSLTGESVNVLPNQSTVYYVDVTNENGCMASDSSRFNIIAPATTISPDQNICSGETVQLVASGADSYVWVGPDLDNNNIPNPTSSTTSDVTYYVTYTTQSCITTDSVSVIIDAPPTATINNGNNPVAFCEGETVDLFVDNLAGWTYVWQGTTNNTNTITVSSAGSYLVTYNDGNCSNTSQVTVVESPKPIIDFSNFTDTVLCCENDELTINFSDYFVSNGANVQTVIWDGNIITNGSYTYSSGDASIDGTSNELHYIEIESDKNCKSEKVYLPLVVTKCANPSFTGPDTIFTNTAEVFDLTVNNNDGSQTYNWTTTDISSGAITDASVEDASVNGINESGETPYEINVSVTNGDCPAEEAEAKTYYVIGLTDPLYPDAFTPNGDDLNKLFKPYVNQFAEITEFRIYNRWGDLVYDMETAENKEGWDGKWKGVDQDIDVYTYYITVKHPDKNIIKEGSFTLLR